MSGNVYEWCADWYASDYYQKSPRQNPLGPSTDSFRVLRGGGWFNVARYCRSANRNNNAPANRNSNVGFRPVRVP